VRSDACFREVCFDMAGESDSNLDAIGERILKGRPRPVEARMQRRAAFMHQVKEQRTVPSGRAALRRNSGDAGIRIHPLQRAS